MSKSVVTAGASVNNRTVGFILLALLISMLIVMMEKSGKSLAELWMRSL